MDLDGEQSHTWRKLYSTLPHSCHLVPRKGDSLPILSKVQVTGVPERSSANATIWEFEVATLDEDGSGFSGGISSLLTFYQVVSLREE